MLHIEYFSDFIPQLIKEYKTIHFHELSSDFLFCRLQRRSPLAESASMM